MISLKKIGLVVSSVLLLSGSAAQAFTVEEVSNLLAQSPGVSGEQFAAMKSHNLPSGDRVLVLYGSSCSDMTEAEAAALVPFVLYKKVATPSGDCVVVPANANVAVMNMTADTGSQTQQGTALEQATTAVIGSSTTAPTAATDGSTVVLSAPQTTGGALQTSGSSVTEVGTTQTGSTFNADTSTSGSSGDPAVTTQSSVTLSSGGSASSGGSQDGTVILGDAPSSASTSVQSSSGISSGSTSTAPEGSASIDGSTIPVIAVPEASTY